MEKTKNSFKVTISTNNNVVTFCEFPVVEPAIALSLDLHKVSNISHEICVVDIDTNKVILSLNANRS